MAFSRNCFFLQPSSSIFLEDDFLPQLLSTVATTTSTSMSSTTMTSMSATVTMTSAPSGPFDNESPFGKVSKLIILKSPFDLILESNVIKASGQSDNGVMDSAIACQAGDPGSSLTNGTVYESQYSFDFLSLLSKEMGKEQVMRIWDG